MRRLFGDILAVKIDAAGRRRDWPDNMPNKVVLPAPFGPMMPSISPLATSNAMAFATWIAPNDLRKFTSRSAAGSCAVCPGSE